MSSGINNILKGADFLMAVHVWACQPKLPTSPSPSFSSILSDDSSLIYTSSDSTSSGEAEGLTIPNASYPRAPSTTLDDWGEEQNGCGIPAPPSKYRKLSNGPIKGSFVVNDHINFTCITSRGHAANTAIATPSTDSEDGPAGNRISLELCPPSPQIDTPTSIGNDEAEPRSIITSTATLKYTAVRPPCRGLKRKRSESDSGFISTPQSTASASSSEENAPSGSTFPVPVPTTSATTASPRRKRPRKTFERSDRVLRSKSATSIEQSVRSLSSGL